MRVLTWTTFGLNTQWVEQTLLPACGRHVDYLDRLEPLETLPDSAGETDWDILFLGNDFEPNMAAFCESVRQIDLHHAMNSIVVIVAKATLDEKLSLMRAGADDVLELGDEAQIEASISRIGEHMQARRTQAEQEKLSLISQLAVSVNHEINNPLAGLMGTAELLLMDNSKSLCEKSKKDIQTIIAQCNRIREITARLKGLNHLRTVPYGTHDKMLDLIGEINKPEPHVNPAVSEEPFLPSPTLLVVDDNPLIVDLIARLLDGRFVVHSADCASEALAVVEREVFDIILVDLILPEMNGLELYRAVRQMRPDQRVLLTTAYHGDARVEQALTEGAVGCVYKPFQLEEFERILNESLKETARV